MAADFSSLAGFLMPSVVGDVRQLDPDPEALVASSRESAAKVRCSWTERC